MRIVLLLVACGVAASLAAAQYPNDVSPDYIRENLAKIPAQDPAPTAAPAVVETMRGRHPRLLLTAEEAARLKAAAIADPLLKPVYEASVVFAKRFSLGGAHPLPHVLGDTPAITNSAQRAPEAVLGYLFERDPVALKALTAALEALLQEEHWALVKELDSNMGAACNMLMAGLLFDAVHDDLDPAFRARVAQRLLVHARRMYWLGHKGLCTMPIKYWQQDPQPNHRWYRAAGLAACVLAIADEPGCDTAFLREQLKQEMDFIVQWLPKDGDCHEGAAYQLFGFQLLVHAASMMDRVLGTEYLKKPGFARSAMQQVYYRAPGRAGNMSFGDDMNGEYLYGTNDAAFFLCPRLTRDPDLQDALLERVESFGQAYHNRVAPQQKRTIIPPWSMLLFYDPSVPRGDRRKLPTARLFADLGAASMRDSWDASAVALTFKCGPIGGYRLNEYAWAHKDEKGEPHYINVAHDDSDANSFALAMDGELLFHPGLYSFTKITAHQSSITVDGVGQLCEGVDYTQPAPGGVDMRTLSYLTAWKRDEQGRVVIEGEAAPVYRGMGFFAIKERQKGRPATDTAPEVKPIPGLPDPVLTRFRRTAVWMPGEYILLLDDIVAAGQREITWRGTVAKAFFDDPANGRCHIGTTGGKRVDMQMLADRPFTGAIDFMLLDGRWGNQLQHQFQFTARSDAVRFACMLDPWKRKLRMLLEPAGKGLVLRITGEGVDDAWTWQPAPDAHAPSALACRRGGGVLLELTAQDRAPHGD
ncbi:MAG: hypothetical protein J0M02_09270 [Planctomycetes bacterium]|nr:hypothetical protein [Planctomycetota bacterium]